MKQRVRDIRPLHRLGDTPSPGDHFAGKSEGWKPFAGTGIPKQHLYERRGRRRDLVEEGPRSRRPKDGDNITSAPRLTALSPGRMMWRACSAKGKGPPARCQQSMASKSMARSMGRVLGMRVPADVVDDHGLRIRQAAGRSSERSAHGHVQEREDVLIERPRVSRGQIARGHCEER